MLKRLFHLSLATLLTSLSGPNMAAAERLCKANLTPEILSAANTHPNYKLTRTQFREFNEQGLSVEKYVEILKERWGKTGPESLYFYLLFMNNRPPCNLDYSTELEALETAYPYFNAASPCREAWAWDQWSESDGGKARKLALYYLKTIGSSMTGGRKHAPNMDKAVSYFAYIDADQLAYVKNFYEKRHNAPPCNRSMEPFLAAMGVTVKRDELNAKGRDELLALAAAGAEAKSDSATQAAISQIESFISDYAKSNTLLSLDAQHLIALLRIKIGSPDQSDVARRELIRLATKEFHGRSMVRVLQSNQSFSEADKQAMLFDFQLHHVARDSTYPEWGQRTQWRTTEDEAWLMVDMLTKHPDFIMDRDNRIWEKLYYFFPLSDAAFSRKKEDGLQRWLLDGAERSERAETFAKWALGIGVAAAIISLGDSDNTSSVSTSTHDPCLGLDGLGWYGGDLAGAVALAGCKPY